MSTCIQVTWQRTAIGIKERNNCHGHVIRQTTSVPPKTICTRINGLQFHSVFWVSPRISPNQSALSSDNASIVEHLLLLFLLERFGQPSPLRAGETNNRERSKRVGPVIPLLCSVFVQTSFCWPASDQKPHRLEEPALIPPDFLCRPLNAYRSRPSEYSNS